jgi:hypothetical protein
MGVHVKVVQELLGHSTVTMTLNVYSHVLPSLQQDAMDKLSNLFDYDHGGDERGIDQDNTTENEMQTE